MRWAVVIPTNRPEKFREFYREWEQLFIEYSVHLVVVEDAETRSDLGIELDNFTHLCWSDVPDFIPRKTDMIRSWGFYKVWKEDLADCVLTLDDDVVPILNPFYEYEQGFKGSVCSEFLSVGALTDSDVQMRGFPYKDRKVAEVAVQYGGWNGVLDYDAATQLSNPKGYQHFRKLVMPVPKGTAVTCCIMNCAFKVEYTPIMWQLTMLEGRYNRVGDIWSGLFIKKVLDSLGKVMLINGKAAIEHNRASDPYNSLQKEAPSVWLNDNLWDNLIANQSSDMLVVYEQVLQSAINFFGKHDKDYSEKLKEDGNKWLGLFKS